DLKKENQKLNKKIDILRKENEELKQKDAILLAKTINIMETHKRAPSITQKSLEPKQDLSGVMPEKKKENLFENQDSKEKSPKPDINLDIVSNKEDLHKTSQSTGKSLEKEMQKEEPGSRKKICPNCGNNNNAFIREFDDKTKIIYTYPRIYAKMYRCGQCGTEWR
ncbi:MAG: hypothetical protein ACFE8G_13225, partial [Candidatus Hermodarchaeota archaeon]